MSSSAEQFRYVGTIIAETRDEPEYLDEIMSLAAEGIAEHVGTIRRVCESSESDDAAVKVLATAAHRLTNVFVALRLDDLSKQINVCEAIARQGKAQQFCDAWNEISGIVDEVYQEVQRYRERRSGI